LADRSRRRIAERFAASMLSALSCLSHQPARLTVSKTAPANFRFEFLPPSRPIILRYGHAHRRLLFSMSYEFSISLRDVAMPTTQVDVSGYSVTLADGFENELLAYHWHPIGLSHVRTPHLHLGASTVRNDAIPINETHLPTGVVTLPEIVRYLIEEIGVEPNRADWKTILVRVEPDL
jgi:hypothetical protein